jgi:hypothetical protein
MARLEEIRVGARIQGVAWPELQKIAAGSAPASSIETAQAELFGHAPHAAAKKSKRPGRKAGGRDGK